MILYIQKNVNRWTVRYDVEENGKLTMSGSKTLGRLLGTGGEESTINFTVETTENRSPLLKIVGYDTYNPKFVEVDDELDRTTETFKEEDKSYKRKFEGSSVLTPTEFFQELILDFEELLSDKVSDAHVVKIAEKSAQVQKPFNRNYRNFVR